GALLVEAVVGGVDATPARRLWGDRTLADARRLAAYLRAVHLRDAGRRRGAGRGAGKSGESRPEARARNGARSRVRRGIPARAHWTRVHLFPQAHIGSALAAA